MRLGEVYKSRLNEIVYVELIPPEGRPIYVTPLVVAKRLAHAILALKPDDLPFVCGECGYIFDKEGHCKCLEEE